MIFPSSRFIVVVMRTWVDSPFRMVQQRIDIRYHLPGLQPEETQRYVAHHLQLAGAREPLLDEQALRAVHEVSFGIPRKIGAVTEAALTYALFAEKRTVTADMVLKVKNLEG
jgi:general secretion pathway protein A